MSTASTWRLDRASLRESLARWHSTDPNPVTRDRVNEWLMDLVLDPLRRGREDPDSPGIFFGRVARTDVGITFVPDSERRIVYVTNIA